MEKTKCPICQGTGKVIHCLTSMPPQYVEYPCSCMSNISYINSDDGTLHSLTKRYKLMEIDEIISESRNDSMKYNTQPPPTNDGSIASWDLVLEDMKNRKQFGIKKYGVALGPNNGRDSLMDAYEEALDLCVYLRNAIYERDNKFNNKN